MPNKQRTVKRIKTSQPEHAPGSMGIRKKTPATKSQAKKKQIAKKKATASVHEEPAVFNSAETLMPVVGVGASAGGLGAFRLLLKQLPADTGMAFVLIQHLDPHHQSLLPKLLADYTAMPVLEARDNMQVGPNQIYVIPPNCTLGIHHGKLQPRFLS